MSERNMELVEKFQSIVKECIHREGIESLLAWLDKTDWYTAPASSKFHGNYPCGLLKHSLRVYEQLKKKQEPGESDETVAIVSLFHDLCKINTYKEHCKSDKGVTKYTYSIENQFPFGHGEKSVLWLVKHIDLTDEEMLVIRWHMGQMMTKNMSEAVAFEQVVHKYKLALKLSQADEEASYWYNE